MYEDENGKGIKNRDQSRKRSEQARKEKEIRMIMWTTLLNPRTHVDMNNKRWWGELGGDEVRKWMNGGFFSKKK